MPKLEPFKFLGPLVAATLAWVTPNAISMAKTGTLPVAPDHVVIVVLENHAYWQIITNPAAPFINQLAAGGATFSQSYGVVHISQPNYIILFSGSANGFTNDNAGTVTAPNLATALWANGMTFRGYAEQGSPRRHNPWESFTNASTAGTDFAAFPRKDYGSLPDVSFVIPNLAHDMHGEGIWPGSISAADKWLKENLSGYAQFCLKHNSLLILTFDEDDEHSDNRILTLFWGQHVIPRHYSTPIDHYTVARTVAALKGLAPIGESASKAPIDFIWEH